jgi:hypothetical protein
MGKSSGAMWCVIACSPARQPACVAAGLSTPSPPPGIHAPDHLTPLHDPSQRTPLCALRVHVFVAWGYVSYSMLLLRWHYQQYIIVRQHYLRKGGQPSAPQGAAQRLELVVHPGGAAPGCRSARGISGQSAPSRGWARRETAGACCCRAGDDANYWRELHLPQRKPRHSVHHRLASVLKALQGDQVGARRCCCLGCPGLPPPQVMQRGTRTERQRHAAAAARGPR